MGGKQTFVGYYPPRPLSVNKVPGSREDRTLAARQGCVSEGITMPTPG
jgi:hypothetical protein